MENKLFQKQVLELKTFQRCLKMRKLKMFKLSQYTFSQTLLLRQSQIRSNHQWKQHNIICKAKEQIPNAQVFISNVPPVRDNKEMNMKIEQHTKSENFSVNRQIMMSNSRQMICYLHTSAKECSLTGKGLQNPYMSTIGFKSY